MTLAFFANGDPKSSMTMSMAKQEKPNPIYSGDPYSSTTSPFPPHQAIFCNATSPICGCIRQSDSEQTTPPPQYLTPFPVSPMPISITQVDWTTGGKILWIITAGSNAMKISKKQEIIQLPSILP